MRGNITGRCGLLATRTLVAVAVCTGLAVSAVAQDAPPAHRAPAPPSEPTAAEAAERAEQQMEEMFEDLPMDINAAGLTSGEGMLGAMFGPSVTKGDFKSYIRILGLDKEQAEAAETVYKQRLENYEVKGKPMQDLLVDALKKMGEAMGRGEHGGEAPDNIDQLTKAADEIQIERESMAKGVMEDLKALATTAQLERWPKVEMAERRNTLMRFQPLMMVPGALIEMRSAVEATLAKKGIEQPVEMGKQQIEQALEAHDLALDEQARLAVPIDAVMRTSSIRNAPSPEQQQEMMKAMGEGMQIADRVRKAHEAAVKSIAAVLSDSTRAVFMDEYHARAFPAVYRTTHGERVLDAAVGLAGLNDEQSGQIRTMREEHLAKLKELRPKAAEQMVEQSRVQAELMAAKDDEARMRLMERMSAAYNENVRDLMRTADKDVVKRVRAMLTEEQREKLPKRPRPNLPFEVKPAGDDGAR